MDSNRHSCEHAEEDYIDMEVGSHESSAIIFSYPRNSSSSSSSYSSAGHIAREFEFQMSSSSGRDTAPSPADELFYKGKLLPLHLPPRLQMVEKLLQNTATYDYNNNNFDESFSTPLSTTPTDNNTPYESCQVSRELNPQDYFLEYSSSSSSSSSDQNNPKKSWTRKLKLINHSSLGSKLKASRAYLKSLFNKTACSTDQTCAAAAAASRNFNEGSSIVKSKESSNKNVKRAARKEPFGQIQKGTAAKQEIPSSVIIKKSLDDDQSGCKGGHHRRSFSGAIKRISMTRSSSSMSSSVSSSASTSTDSNGFRELQFFKRSNSVNSDIESPIQAAIAHCKRSHQQQEHQLHSRKNVSDLGFYSLSAAKVVVHHEEQRPTLCRG